MSISVFDLFTIGIGPSSSHSVGPMRAARRFVERLTHDQLLHKVAAIEVRLYGSLAHTGKGHGTDKAILLGLEGNTPEEIDPRQIDAIIERIRRDAHLQLPNGRSIPFSEKAHLLFRKREMLPLHSNGMRFDAFDETGEHLLTRTYYSVGGGFVLNADEAQGPSIVPDNTPVPYPFQHAADLLRICKAEGLSISQIMWENEKAWRSEADIRSGLLKIWQAMQQCIERGCMTEGILPGGLNVKRRAPQLYRELSKRPESSLRDPLTVLDWVNLYALAVNEENAAGGRVVTAPTNGAAGIIPAVMHYYERFNSASTEEKLIDFLLTSAAIGILYKQNASISGAEVGCQGEVGVACSMAAGALTQVMGGNPMQVEQAAEIGMEHNLGLTCDPIGGLVQVPCIERNAMGAVKAINASRMALRGDGSHFVSLDKVIATMRRTGEDMSTKYKETSRGGLALNIIEC